MKKLSFDELVSDFESSIQKDVELRAVTGGDRIYINGGYVENYGGGAAFYSNNGTCIDLPGVNVQEGWGAMQNNGTIVLNTSWADVNVLVHEYGHYLQQQEWGSSAYASQIPGSVWSALTNSYTQHYYMPFESDAWGRGYTYVATYSPGFVY